MVKKVVRKMLHNITFFKNNVTLSSISFISNFPNTSHQPKRQRERNSGKNREKQMERGKEERVSLGRVREKGQS